MTRLVQAVARAACIPVMFAGMAMLTLAYGLWRVGEIDP